MTEEPNQVDSEVSIQGLSTPRRLAGKNWLTGGLALGGALLGFIQGAALGNFDWFARSGALVAALGVLILVRPALLKHQQRQHIRMAETGLDTLDLRHWQQIGRPVPGWVIEYHRDELAVWRLGPAVTIMGALISGYGDLLGRICIHS